MFMFPSHDPKSGLGSSATSLMPRAVFSSADHALAQLLGCVNPSSSFQDLPGFSLVLLFNTNIPISYLAVAGVVPANGFSANAAYI